MENRNVILLLLSIIVIVLVINFTKDNRKDMSDMSLLNVVDSLTIDDNKRELTAWELMQLGLIMVESEGNEKAVSKKGARGIFQITSIYVKEVNRLCLLHKIEKSYTLDDAFDVKKSFEMFDIMTTYKYNQENESERIAAVIKNHNPNAGDWYAKRVYKAMTEIMFNEELKDTYIKFLD